jgi:hypothetical protein
MGDQEALFDERRPLQRSTAPARHTDPETSKEAAKLPFKRESQRHRLLIEYRDADMHGTPEGLTDEEAAKHAGINKGCPWKRCSELRQDLLIAPIHGTGGSIPCRISENGGPQQVCAITGKGRAVLEQLRG